MSEALDNDIINLDDVRRKIEMKKRTDILAAHKYAITYGKDGYWKTYVPDSTKKTGRKLLKKNTKEKLEQAIILHYKKQTDTDTLTLETLYPKWLKYYSLHTNSSSTVKRITSDWNKYYKNDNLIKQPIKSLLKAFVKGGRGYFSYYLRRFSLCFCLNNAFQSVLSSQTATMVKKHFDFIICFALLNHKNSIRFVFLRMVILGG